MAVIDVYQNNSQVGAPAKRTGSARPDMSGQMALAKADAGLTNTLVEGGQKLYEQMAVADVMKANNDYNMQMNKLQTELLQNKEENARDNLTKYEEGRQKIVESIMKKGPATLRGVLGQKAFFNTIDRDWTAQRTQMERYTIGEMEKYQDTQLNNQYQLALKDIAANWNDSEALDAAMRRGEFMTAARYANYGQEKIKEAGDKWKAAVVSTAAQAAINADTSEGWARGGAILQGYGYLMNPDDRLRFDKMISAREKANNELNMFANIYAKYGNDIEGGIAEALKNYTGTADVSKGLDFARGEEGKAWGSNQCANFVKKYIQMAGGDGDIGSSLADGTYLNAQKKGLTFTDRSQLKDGDIVYWQVDGSKYAASDNPEDVHSDSKAYKGITHVGVYDAKSGQVIQSGEHGVSAMDMDAAGYHVVGFSHIGGRAMDAAERDKLIQGYTQYVTQQQSRKRMAKDAAFNNFSSEAVKMFENGTPIEEALRQADIFGGHDEKMRDMARKAVGTAYSWAGNRDILSKRSIKGAGQGGSSKGLAIGQKQKLIELLEGGNFADKEEFADFVLSYGPSKNEYDSLMKTYDNFEKGTGEYKYNWTNIEKIVKASTGLKGAYEQTQWVGAKDAGVEFIKDYMAKNGVVPSDGEVIQACIDSMTKQTVAIYSKPGLLWGTNEYPVEASPADLARAGIRKNGITAIGGGIYKVEMNDGRIFSMSGEDLKRRINE